MKFLNSFFRRRDSGPKTDLSLRFDLISRLGTGSMSKVWRAVDKNIGRVVALKVLDVEKTLRYESRFADRVKPTEGEVASQLTHPNIVHTLEHGRTTRGEQYLVMELIEGIGLAYLVDSQNDVMQAHRLRLMIELGEALEYLHKENWIHRDICPRNVLINKDYSTRLIDFGLVVPNTAAFQEPGNRTGTANYMAPELIKRQRTDQRIDIFSYAVTCYEMYCRSLPWPSITGASLEMVLKRINQKPEEIQDVVQLDKQIGAAIMKGLEADPRERWQTMTEMLHELREAYQRLTPVAKKPTPAATAKKRAKRRDDSSDKWQFRTQ
ncbi:MAG TPA: serine/threonine-protein kinase [Planctomycetaceae bacterium]|jgi:serine/threonine protein kinase|nr:serine/threonine-protein kinase [Planctomycetaceae bacterium]